MANALVELLRQTAPEDTKQYTDRQLTKMAGDTFRNQGILDLEEAYPDFRDEYLDIRLDRTSMVDESTSALATALFDRLPNMGFAIGSATVGEAASALGWEGPRDYAIRNIERNQEEAADRIGDRAVSRVEDIRGPRSLIRYALPTFLENAPQLGISVAAGVAGTVLGGPIGGAAAAGAASMAQNFGEQYADLATNPDADRSKILGAAAVGGTLAGLIDAASAALPAAGIAAKLFPKASSGAISKLVQSVIGRSGVRGAMQGLAVEGASEGVTEAIQEAIAIASEEYATGSQIDAKEIRSRLLNAGVAGALVGGPIGAATGAIPGKKDKKKADPKRLTQGFDESGSEAFTPLLPQGPNGKASLMVLDPAIDLEIVDDLPRNPNRIESGQPQIPEGATDIEEVPSGLLPEGTRRLPNGQQQIAEGGNDYDQMLLDMGVTDEQIRQISRDDGDVVPMPAGFPVQVGPSPIEGQGLLTTGEVEAGETVAPARIEGNRTPAGRFINHSGVPNSVMRALPSGDIEVVATQPIEKGEEVTVDYRQSAEVAGNVGNGESVPISPNPTLTPLPPSTQFSINRPLVEDGREITPEWIQIDLDPENADGQAESSNPDELRARNYDVPEIPDDLPSGNYTVVNGQFVKALTADERAEAERKSLLPTQVSKASTYFPAIVNFVAGIRGAGGPSKSKAKDAGTFIVALLKDGQVEIRNLYKAGKKKVMVENSVEMSEGKRAPKNTTGRSLDSVEDFGYEILGVYQLAAPSKDLVLSLSEEEFQQVIAANRQVESTMQELSESGQADEVLLAMLQEHPDTLNAVNALESLITHFANSSRTKTLTGITAPMDSMRKAMKRVGKTDDPTALLSSSNGLILGKFTPQMWQMWVELVNSADGMRQSQDVESVEMTVAQAELVRLFAYDPNNPKLDDSLGNFAMWAQEIAKRGEERQAGGRIVSLDSDEVADVGTGSTEGAYEETLEDLSKEFFTTIPEDATLGQFAKALRAFGLENIGFLEHLESAKKPETLLNDLYEAFTFSNSPADLARAVSFLVYGSELNPVTADQTGGTTDQQNRAEDPSGQDGQGVEESDGGVREEDSEALPRQEGLSENEIARIEAIKKVEAARQKKRAKYVKSRAIGLLPTGDTDLLNLIEDSGGIESPYIPGTFGKKGQHVGGEYDGYTEAFGRRAGNIASRLVRAKGIGGMKVDTLVGHLNSEHGTKFESISDFYVAVENAVKQRNRLNALEKAERATYNAEQAMLGEVSKKQDSILIDELGFGDTFKVNGFEMTVVDITPEYDVILRSDIPNGDPIVLHSEEASIAIDKGTYGKAPRKTGTDDSAPFSEPVSDGFAATNAQVRAATSRVVDLLRRAGIPVKLIAGVQKDLASRGLTRKTRDQAKLVKLWMKDVLNPSTADLKVALHETAHVLFAEMPEATKVRIQNAISHMTDKDLGINPGLNRSIENAIRDGDPARLAEERMAVAMEKAGVPGSAGLARQLWTAIKLLYNRIAVAVAEFLGNPEQADAFALRYFEERMNWFLSGGEITGFSLVNFIGGPIPNFSRRNKAIRGFARTDEKEDGSLFKPPHSDEGVAFNMDLIDFYSVQSIAAEPVGGRQNKAHAIHSNVAAINDQIAVENKILAELDGDPAIAAEAKAMGLTPIQLLRQLFKLDDPNAHKESILGRVDPETGEAIAGVDPEFRTEFFKDESNQARARVMAYQANQRRADAVSAQMTEAQDSLKRAIENRDRRDGRWRRLTNDFLNADGLSAEISRAVRMMLRSERAGVRVGKKLGAIMQQLRQLDTREANLIHQSYAGVFKKLHRGRDLTGRNLFSVLDAMTNEANIDFSKSIKEIRFALADAAAATGSPELAMLTNSTPEANALLATAVAYAKANEKMMADIARRRDKSRQQRQELQAELDEILGSTRPMTDRTIREMGRARTLKERARQAYYAERKAIQRLDNEIKLAEAKISMAAKALPLYKAERERLARFFNLRPHYVFTDGSTYTVPVNENATGEDLRKPAHQVTLKLNAAGDVTDPNKLRADLEDMTHWIDARIREAEAGDFDAMNTDFYAMKAQRDELLIGLSFEADVRKVDFFTKGLAFLSAGKIAMGFGTPTGRRIQQMFNQESAVMGSLRSKSEKFGNQNNRLAARVVRMLKKGHHDMDRDRYFDLFLDPAKSIIEKERGLLEQGLTPAQVKTRLDRIIMNYFENNPMTSPYVRGRETQVMAAIREHIDSQADTSAWFHHVNNRFNLGIKDDRLIAEDLSGRTKAGIRDSFAQGAQTFSRTISDGLKHTYTAMAITGAKKWTGFREDINGSEADPRSIAEVYEEEGANGVKLRMGGYFDKGVWRGFVQEIANSDTYSAFDAPLMADGITRPEADPAKVAEAFRESGGDIIRFVELMQEKHGGNESTGAYLQNVFEQMADYFGQIKEIVDGAEPEFVGRMQSVKDMVPNLMIDARILERWPTAWSQYLTFDAQTNHNLVTRVAAQVAFGRNQERLASAYELLRKEVDTMLEPLKQDLKYRNPGETLAQQQKRIAKNYTPKRFKRLKVMLEREPLLNRSIDHILDYYQSKHTDLGATRWGTQTVQTLAQLMLNQPGTAMLQLSELFSPIITHGVSKATVKQVLTGWKVFGEDFANSVSQMIGFELVRQSRLSQLYYELGYNDPMTHMKFIDWTNGQMGSDIMSDIGRRNEASDIGLYTRTMRRLPKVIGFGLNAKGEDAKSTVFRPLAPFSQTIMHTNRALTVGLWQRVEDMVGQGIEFLNANPELDADPSYELTEKDLGYTGLEAESQKKVLSQMKGFGLELTSLVREAQNQDASVGTNELLSENTRAMLHGLALNEISLEGNLATMAPRTFTSSLLRMILPLWGWPIRRMFQVSGSRLDTKGQIKLAAVSQGLLAIAVASSVGLGYSMLIDQYHEKILRKKRNLRSASGIPASLGAGQYVEALMGFVEATNRVGTYGLFGEVANTALNVAAGEGDNRGISLDQRVVMANSMMTLFRGVSNLIAQRGDVDYQNVFRPMFAAMGGNGLLQYMEMTNNAFDLDNAEARAVRRMNAQNWMRVSGRTNELEVRKSTGGFSQPNTLTPIMTRMVMAAFGENSEDFRRYYRDAIAEAKKQGKEDPVAYVRDSFRARHPLRSVFRTVTEGDYRSLVGSMPKTGRDDVTSAVTAYNAYAARLGIEPYFGSKGTSKKKKGPLASIQAQMPRPITAASLRKQALGR